MSLGFGFSLPAYLGSGGAFAGATLNLDFTSGNQTLDPRITFTRSTTATFTGSNGLIQTAAIDAPRFDYNPTTLAPLGLLIEEQRVNLVTYSEQFDNAVWTKIRSSITSNTVVAPDGTLTGDALITDTTVTDTHRIELLSVAFTSGTTYTLTLFAKAQSSLNLQLVFLTAAFGTSLRAAFNLQTGQTLVSSSSITAKTTNVGNGWFRCEATATATATATSGFHISLINTFAANAAATSFTGDGTSGIYIWGAQLEAGAFATSYIPTVASQVTRAADVAVMTGTNFSSWYNATEGTLYGQADWMGLSTNDYFFAINNGTSSNLIAIGVSNTPLTRFIVIDGGVTQASVSGPTPVANVAFKIAGAYQANSFAAATNGVLGTVDTSGSVPTGMSAVSFTSSFGGFNLFNGHIRQIAYYPRRLANAELQGITA